MAAFTFDYLLLAASTIPILYFDYILLMTDKLLLLYKKKKNDIKKGREMINEQNIKWLCIIDTYKNCIVLFSSPHSSRKIVNRNSKNKNFTWKLKIPKKEWKIYLPIYRFVVSFYTNTQQDWWIFHSFYFFQYWFFTLSRLQFIYYYKIQQQNETEVK